MSTEQTYATYRTNLAHKELVRQKGCLDVMDGQCLPPSMTGSLQRLTMLRTVREATIFSVGVYLYSFEFLLHNFLSESIKTELISTQYYLQAIVEPHGPIFLKGFSASHLFHCQQNTLLEMIEPIIFTRNWREQLAYYIYILESVSRSACRYHPE